MQLGLMAKLIGRPVEVKALPVTLRYPPATLRSELLKAGLGAALCFGVVFGLDPSPWVAVPVALLGVLFAGYGLVQWRRGGVTFELDEKAVTRIQGTRRTVIPWDQLDSFRLHFYAFGRKAREGTLEVRLGAAAGRFKADSTLDHFPTLLVQAARVSRARNLPLDPTTAANLEQLGL